MSKDLIRRSVAIKAFTFNSKGERIPFVDCDNFPVEFPLRYIVDTLVALPSADRPKGEWIGEADGYADGELVYDTWYCSNCDYVVDDEEPPTWNYCPNCGSYNGGGQSD